MYSICVLNSYETWWRRKTAVNAGFLDPNPQTLACWPVWRTLLACFQCVSVWVSISGGSLSALSVDSSMLLHEATTLLLTLFRWINGVSQFPGPLRNDQDRTSDLCCLFWTLCKRIQKVYLLGLAFFKYAQILRICPCYKPFTSLSYDKEIINVPAAAVYSPQKVSSEDTHIGNKPIPGCLLCSACQETHLLSHRGKGTSTRLLEGGRHHELLLCGQKNLKGWWESKLGNSVLWTKA